MQAVTAMYGTTIRENLQDQAYILACEFAVIDSCLLSAVARVLANYWRGKNMNWNVFSTCALGACACGALQRICIFLIAYSTITHLIAGRPISNLSTPPAFNYSAYCILIKCRSRIHRCLCTHVHMFVRTRSPIKLLIRAYQKFPWNVLTHRQSLLCWMVASIQK